MLTQRGKATQLLTIRTIRSSIHDVVYDFFECVMGRYGILKYYIINMIIYVNVKFLINYISRKQMKGKEMEKWIYDQMMHTYGEYASNHCQVGNIGLALGYIIDWIKERCLAKE